jgi:hypothetical protein
MRTHEERVLVAKLGGLNADLSRFILAVLQADHQGTSWPHTAEDEHQLGVRLVELGHRVQTHAERLKGTGGGKDARPTVIDGAFAVDIEDRIEP